MVPPLHAAALLLLVLFPVCAPENKTAAAEGPISRIISLSPSISREIDDLGAGGLLVGVTSYDDYRDRGMEVVGTLMQPNIEKIIMLKPDLVLFSAEDGLVQNAGRLIDAGVAAHRFARNKNFDDILNNYLILADILGKEDTARKKIGKYREMRDRVKSAGLSDTAPQRPHAVFLLSCSPLIVASADSFIGQIIRDAGGTCFSEGGGGPHPLISVETLVVSDPDLIITMTGDEDTGYFFRRLAADFGELRAMRYGNIFSISDDNIPYYTPADYVKSLEKMAVMMQKAKAALRQSRTAADTLRE
jgi:iron complex transport system substrate-binding protein